MSDWKFIVYNKKGVVHFWNDRVSVEVPITVVRDAERRFVSGRMPNAWAPCDGNALADVCGCCCQTHCDCGSTHDR